MKSKLLSAFVWIFIALTPLAGRLAFADDMGMTKAKPTLQLSCSGDDWSIDSPRCPNFLPTREGKAAYGEGMALGNESTVARGAFCGTEGDDWNYNDANCHPRHMEGKAAFGEPVRTQPILPASCGIEGNDWFFDDPKCPR